ncbi:hypothetical protein HBI56_163020 [Parastagonospora nodorum]|nr:hypothetical protein HBH56_125300 [Parastagonospora nodorum]KAH3931158.1 hypothetical protein HBH54_098210 [Parastagonospora nodorum]KAH3944449.1 hypothetical protein HBH53_159680 [Parastagonospora nodorum]KAH3956888.1 hypothetical protein HBH51_233610 [Parastagonospora nodorum]KAH3971496.1 hypothetical protein HBH52_154400 [Parastagonospora nodorum]
MYTHIEARCQCIISAHIPILSNQQMGNFAALSTFEQPRQDPISASALPTTYSAPGPAPAPAFVSCYPALRYNIHPQKNQQIFSANIAIHKYHTTLTAPSRQTPPTFPSPTPPAHPPHTTDQPSTTPHPPPSSPSPPPPLSHSTYPNNTPPDTPQPSQTPHPHPNPPPTDVPRPLAQRSHPPRPPPLPLCPGSSRRRRAAARGLRRRTGSRRAGPGGIRGWRGK